MLVTGASAGIGREIVLQLAARAGTLVLLARRAERLEELRASLLERHPQLQVVALPVNLSDAGAGAAAARPRLAGAGVPEEQVGR